MKGEILLLLYNMNDSVDYQYESMLKEINTLRISLDKADEKARKKANKKFNENGFYPYEIQLEARKKVLENMQNSKLLERVAVVLKKVLPYVKLIANAIAALIVILLSLSGFRNSLSSNTLKILDGIYELAISVG